MDVKEQMEQALNDGSVIRGRDGTDIILRGDGWYFEHFRITDSGDAQIIFKSGPYMAVGVPRLIETAYRAKFNA